MDSREKKAHENYLRRQAIRLDLYLKNSRAKQWRFNNQLGYMITDPYLNAVIVGSNFDYELDDIEEFLNEYEENLRKA